MLKLRVLLAAPCSKQLEGEAEVGKLEALQWVNALLSQDARLLQEQQALLLAALCDALSAASGVRGGACPMRSRHRAGRAPTAAMPQGCAA